MTTHTTMIFFNKNYLIKDFLNKHKVITTAKNQICSESFSSLKTGIDKLHTLVSALIASQLF